MKLAVPDMISNSYFPVLAAVELGFFRKEGLDMHLELMSPADKAYGALREGDVDRFALTLEGGAGTKLSPVLRFVSIAY